MRNPADETVAAAALRIEMQLGSTVAAKRRYREFEAMLQQERHGPPGPAMRAALEQSAVPVAQSMAETTAVSALAADVPIIAVLPFDNLSSDVEMAYFSDGVSEDILSRLLRVSKLRVVGRMSSFQFRDARKPMAAAALNATHILDGSVRRAGSKVRITAHLTDASGATLWSDQYDRNLEDIFAVQDEISEAIAGKLQTAFFAEKSLKIDPDVYDLFLQARAIYADDLRWADQEQCILLLTQAISLAPDFAEAWGRLAVYRRGTPAIVAAQRALELDPDCAVSLSALAMTRPSFSGHRDKLKLAERAYRLAPDDQLVAGVYNLLLLSLGLVSQALEIALVRFERDPLSPMVAGGLAMMYRSAGMTSEAHALADQAVTSLANPGYVRFIRCAIAVFDGDMECATAMAETDPADGDILPMQPLIMFVQAVASMDAADRSATVHAFLHRNAPKSSFLDVGLAAAMGEGQMAMDCLLATICQGHPLEFASENDGRGMVDAAVTAGLFMPGCEALRRDVRFAEVCVRLGLYDFWRETGTWPDCVADLADIYDFKAECERIDSTADRYLPLAVE